MAGETRTVALYGGKGEVTVSLEDYDWVVKCTWYLNDYARDGQYRKLHIIIMGERPADIPADYVIDHADRNKLNNARGNLRWVSQQFNTWNVAIGADSFKGVSWDKSRNKWFARLCGTYLGRFADKKHAARAVARAAVEKWPLWAPTSDLLVGPGLLSKEEMDEICAEVPQVKILQTRELPKGVLLKGSRYCIRFRSKQLHGSYGTAEEAFEALTDHARKVEEQEEREHLSKPILRNQDGHAIIPLGGQKGKGLFTSVPDNLWHSLMKAKWSVDGEYARGRWQGETKMLHSVVFALSNPNYDRSLSIDHRIPENKLDNRLENLRVATPPLQSHNKCKKVGTSSHYIGVTRTKCGTWHATIRFHRKQYHLGTYKIEHDAARARNAKAVELFGDDATVQVIQDED